MKAFRSWREPIGLVLLGAVAGDSVVGLQYIFSSNQFRRCRSTQVLRWKIPNSCILGNEGKAFCTLRTSGCFLTVS